jgi:hypothetical protein
MERLRSKKPSPAMIVAIVALVFAVAGTSVAGVATISVLSKKEKKQTSRIAKNEINKAAPGLSVANAATAGNANTLGGLTAAQLQQPIAFGDWESGALVAGSTKNVNSVRDAGSGSYCIDVSITPKVAVANADPGDSRFASATAAPSGCMAGEDIQVFTATSDSYSLLDSDFNFVAFGG